MHVPSKFNRSLECPDGSLLIYNSYTGSICKISPQNRDACLDWLNGPSRASNPACESLAERGYLVDANEDEIQKCRYLQSKLLGEQSLNLIILPTEQCNFRCLYCYENFARGIMSETLQESLVKFVRKNIKKHSSLRVSWFGGEPLLAAGAIGYLSAKFQSICAAIKRPYFSDMTTNAYLLNLGMLRKMNGCNVLSYQITIDGTRDTHDSLRPLAGGAKTFDTVTSNLLDIKNNVKTGRFQIIIRTNFTNDMDIEKYAKHFSGLFGDDKRFLFFVRTAGDWGGTRVDEIRNALMGNDSEAKLYEKLAASKTKLNLVLHESFLMPLGSVCYACRAGSLVIDSAGNIRRCTCSLDDDEHNKIGELDLDGNMRINAGKASMWLPQMPQNPKCLECFFLPACFRSACPRNLICSRNEAAPCPHEKENIDSVLLMLDNCNEYETIF
jgi:uncharacterized protein